MTRAKDISKIITDADFSGTLDVTGTVTAGGLTVNGDGSLNGTAVNLIFNETDTTDLNTRFRQSGALFSISTVNDSGSSPKAHLVVNNSTGDISFYEDTGTTPKLFWDASAERLGIGTSSPSHELTVAGSTDTRVTIDGSNSAGLYISDSGANGITIRNTNNGDLEFLTVGGKEVVFNQLSADTDFRVESDNNTHALFVQGSNGNVGIGTGSPATNLHIAGSGTGLPATSGTTQTYGRIRTSGSGSNAVLDIGNAGATGAWLQVTNQTSLGVEYPLLLNPNGGNVGIGESSPDKLLHLKTSQSVTCEIKIEAPRDRGRLSFHSQTNSGTDYEMGKIEIDRSSGTLQTAHMIFATNGGSGNTERMRIDSAGNVGIGTSNPYKSLTVGDSDATAYISAGGNNVNLSIASIGSSGSVIFKTGGTNGNAATTTERMRIRYDGKVGIGNTNPEGALHIDLSGNGSESTPHLQIGQAVGYSGYHWLDGTAYYIGQDSTLRQLRLYSGAETAGVVMGNGATSWSSFSDERIKKDVEPISNGLQKLADLRCVSYRLKDVDANDSQKKLGIIAQDLVGKVDEVIDLTKRKDDETEYMSVRYTEMIPVLIKAIQELKAELDSAKAQITTLENA